MCPSSGSAWAVSTRGWELLGPGPMSTRVGTCGVQHSGLLGYSETGECHLQGAALQRIIRLSASPPLFLHPRSSAIAGTLETDFGMRLGGAGSEGGGTRCCVVQSSEERFNASCVLMTADRLSERTSMSDVGACEASRGAVASPAPRAES